MPSEYKDAVQGQQSFWQPSGQITQNKWTVGCSESKATGGIRPIREADILHFASEQPNILAPRVLGCYDVEPEIIATVTNVIPG